MSFGKVHLSRFGDNALYRLEGKQRYFLLYQRNGGRIKEKAKRQQNVLIKFRFRSILNEY